MRVLTCRLGGQGRLSRQRICNSCAEQSFGEAAELKPYSAGSVSYRQEESDLATKAMLPKRHSGGPSLVGVIAPIALIDR